MCEHLFAAVTNTENELFLTFPKTRNERENCFYMATGRYCPDDSLPDWFVTFDYRREGKLLPQFHVEGITC